MNLLAAAVQSALGTSTPPADSSNNSTSSGATTTLASLGKPVKPGARLRDCA